jgi:hypothetical protein
MSDSGDWRPTLNAERSTLNATLAVGAKLKKTVS